MAYANLVDVKLMAVIRQSARESEYVATGGLPSKVSSGGGKMVMRS